MTDTAPDTAMPAEIASLVERLRERAESYRMGGPSSEHTAALLDEAATALASERAAHAETKRALDGVIEACNHTEAQALGLAVDLKTTEAALAETRKALDALDRMSRGVDWCDQDEQARRWSAARRALEGGE